MPINSKHPDYLQYLPQWSRCRAAMQGADAIKGSTTLPLHAYDTDTVELRAMHTWRTDTVMTAGRAYLPQPSGMSAVDYQHYKIRACWVGFSARVRQRFVSLAFREPPAVVVPTALEPHLLDITRTGVSLDAFSYHMVTEDWTTGRFGLLLDLPEVPQAANAVRPQWALYRAEQVINWHIVRTPDGALVYDWLILEEDIDVLKPDDPYEHIMTKQWRELRCDTGVYTMSVWQQRQGPEGEHFVQVEEPRVPTRRGVPLTFIPFAMDEALESPPLLDVVDVNLAHYRTNADYKHSLHMSALATPWVTGWDNVEAELRIGASTAWIIPEPQARVGYLEPSGSGLQAMLNDMQAAEAQMAALGARLLEPQRRAVEAAQTHEIRQVAELSIMQTYAIAASTLVERALRWHAWWAGVTEDLDDETITFLLNTDFLPETIDAPTMTALVNAWHAGALTQEDLYYNFEQGNLLAPGTTFEEWQAKLAEEGAMALLAGPVMGAPGQNGRGTVLPPGEGNGQRAA
jgi:hypothetical protein